MYTTSWDSFFVHYDKVRSALGDGRVVEVMGGLLQIVLLIIPVAGITLLFALMGKRLSTAMWRWSGRKPAGHAALIAVFAAAVAFALFSFARSTTLLVDSPGVSAGVTSFLKAFDDEHILRDLGLALLTLVVGGVIGWKLPVEDDDLMPVRFSSGILVLVLAILLVIVDGLLYYL
jgi:hypothetical protein